MPILMAILSPSVAVADEYRPRKLPLLETQFYNLNIDSYRISDDDPILLANTNESIFMGLRKSKKILKGKFDSKSNILKTSEVGFRVPFGGHQTGDLLLDMIANSQSLFVAIGVQSALDSKVCGGVKVLKYNLKNPSQDGQIVFSSSPCIRGEIGKFPWTARLAIDDDRNRLFIAGGNTLIDFQFGTWPSDQIPYLKQFPKKPLSNFYGKVIQLDLNSGQITTYATGIRNLGGLFYDKAQKALYLSDNGPRGGDMLYKLQKGGNYAWPTTTLGRPYGSGTTNSGQVQVNKFPDAYPPLFSWTPSISPSMLTRVTSDKFPYWKNNLIVGSLKGNSVRRLYQHQNVIVYDEVIPLGTRIRSLLQLKNGNILVGGDDGNLLSITPDGSQPGGPYPPIKS